MQKTMNKAFDYEWRSFDDARKYVQSLRLKNWQEWRDLVKSDALPDDIPDYPNIIYKEKGWVSFGDWLGMGRIFHLNIVNRPFVEARTLVRNLGLKTEYQYKAWARSSKCPDDIPVNPREVYKYKGWISLKNWLGIERIYKYENRKCSFEEARDYARSLGLHSFSEWLAWSKSDFRPNDIPSGPWITYKGKGWIGIRDWLGTAGISTKKVYLRFEDAREFVRNLGLSTIKEWREWAKSTKRPDNIPITPQCVYKNRGWKGYTDWLGWIINNRREGYRPFEEARDYARSLGLKSVNEWQSKAKSGTLPDDIPYYPSVIYRGKGWVSFGDWLGVGRISFRKKDYRPFIEARNFVRSLGLKNSREWKAWVKKVDRPIDIPAVPCKIYKNEGWVNIKDWLGTERFLKYQNKKCSFEEARDFARLLGLHTYSEWKRWAKSGLRPLDIPAGPWNYYKEKGWISIGDWLGTGSISKHKRVYLPFEVARAYVHKLKINNIEEWQKWARNNYRSIDIPISPHYVYRNKGWKGYGDWLGIGNKIHSR